VKYGTVEVKKGAGRGAGGANHFVKMEVMGLLEIDVAEMTVDSS
jgi:hypothetical protein